MRKELKVKMSWLSKDNWEKLIDSGYLPVLAISHPRRFGKTQIHFPELSFKLKHYKSLEEAKDIYWDMLSEKVNPWKILNTFDVLAHLACASGVVILTDRENDPFREVLGKFLDGILDEKITEYEWDRERD